MSESLNARARMIVDEIHEKAARLRVEPAPLVAGAQILDCGVQTQGGLEAGRLLALTCLAGMADVSLVLRDWIGVSWPHVQVTTDSPVEACLFSQYAGWQISVGDYFAIGSGPMRAAAACEEIFSTLWYRETPDSVVGILEAAELPDEAVIRHIAEKSGVAPMDTTLLVASTASQAGNVQVVARSVETALHKLFELQFDVRRVRSAMGIAPLPPVAVDDLTAIGRTNDAILYGACVTLWVIGDDASLAAIGPRVPASASESFGRPFLDIFEEAGRDFYEIDPNLFSPAEIVFQNVETGHVHHFGATVPKTLVESFGLCKVP